MALNNIVLLVDTDVKLCYYIIWTFDEKVNLNNRRNRRSK